ncbi:unnamed protein product [Fraxinus pennsylvanica]|uniref:Uncharacterized protein n=1 Tax=Fraxinus pennsylvanica TaxID=56036 RepID=A0AAD1Z0S4_9LAMI|nr:unnamed protein product [Fraxinus pennsylvanica]
MFWEIQLQNQLLSNLGVCFGLIVDLGLGFGLIVVVAFWGGESRVGEGDRGGAVSVSVAVVSGFGATVLTFYFTHKCAIAAPVLLPPTVETTTKDAPADKEREKFLEEQVFSNPYDIDSLKNLLEIKFNCRKFPEAIGVLDKLIELKQEETKWLLMKAHFYIYLGDNELAKYGFGELLKKDPFHVEAYSRLLIDASQEESSKKLEEIEKSVEEVMNVCKKKNKKFELREFKLLLAQIRVMERRYDEALKVYQELVNEEPRDFRPYLCQGIIYTLLRKNVDAEKNFEKFRRLVPRAHPYARHFEDDLIAAKIFGQKM